MPKSSRLSATLLPALGLGSLLVAATYGGQGALGQLALQKTASLKPVSATSPNLPDYKFDTNAETQLLDLANQARTKAGEAPLRLDPGLSAAARFHAKAMAATGQISHQFDGEPVLTVRLASATSLRLERAGENVALDSDPEDAHERLMESPPHRENLLNSAYDVVGLGVVSAGGRLYIVQDFGRSLPSLSAIEMKNRVANAVAGMRQQSNQLVLPRHDLAEADAAACSMAQADTLSTLAIRQLAARYGVLTYTTQHPEQLPAGADAALSAHDLRSFSIGGCFSRTKTYPAGVYWIVLTLR